MHGISAPPRDIFWAFVRGVAASYFLLSESSQKKAEREQVMNRGQKQQNRICTEAPPPPKKTTKKLIGKVVCVQYMGWPKNFFMYKWAFQMGMKKKTTFLNFCILFWSACQIFSLRPKKLIIKI